MSREGAFDICHLGLEDFGLYTRKDEHSFTNRKRAMIMSDRPSNFMVGLGGIPGSLKIVVIQ
jgi:hypothetical protein